MSLRFSFSSRLVILVVGGQGLEVDVVCVKSEIYFLFTMA